MKPDVRNSADIHEIMKNFYSKLLRDDSVSYLFTDVAKIQLDEHLDELVAFWDQILFSNYGYEKNVMNIHRDIHEKSQFTEEHFKTWMQYFYESIDEKHEGEIAQNMKDRAYSIAYLMRTKFLK